MSPWAKLELRLREEIAHLQREGDALRAELDALRAASASRPVSLVPEGVTVLFQVPGRARPEYAHGYGNPSTVRCEDLRGNKIEPVAWKRLPQ